MTVHGSVLLCVLLQLPLASVHGLGIPDDVEMNKYVRELSDGILVSLDQREVSFLTKDGLHESWSLSVSERERVQSFMADELRGVFAVFTRGWSEPPEGYVRLYDLRTRTLLFERRTIGPSFCLGSRFLVWVDLGGLGRTDREALTDVRSLDIPVRARALTVEQLDPTRFALGGFEDPSGTITIYDAQRHAINAILRLSSFAITSLHVDAGRDRLLAGDAGGSLHALRITPGGLELASTLQAASGRIIGLDTDRDGRVFAVTSRYEVAFISPDVLGVEATIRIDELYPSTIPREAPRAGYCGINSVAYLDADRTLLISDVARNFYSIDVETLDVARFSPMMGSD